MTLRTRFVLSALFALGTTMAASAQQWGPSAQSHVYHDPSNPQVLTAYNTTAIAPRSQQPQAQAAAATRRSPAAVAPKTSATARRRSTTLVHRTAYHGGQ